MDGTWNGLLMVALALSHLLEAEMDRALANAALSARSFVALFEIAREPVPAQEPLARRLGLGPSATSELLRRLEQQGLIRRDPARRGGLRPRPANPHAAVTLTDEGVSAVARAVAIAARLEDDWAGRLTVATGGGTQRYLGYGLWRWMSESLAALTAQPCGINSKPAAAK